VLRAFDVMVAKASDPRPGAQRKAGRLFRLIEFQLTPHEREYLLISWGGRNEQPWQQWDTVCARIRENLADRIESKV
jgi:hypothetical protein